MWILLCGAALALTPPAPDAEPTQTRLSVATLNTWGLPAPVASDRRGRLPLIASWLSERSYDVAGLEELWAGAHRWFPLRDLVLPQQRGDSGLAIVTSWPVVQTLSHAFVYERGIDKLKAKGLLTAEIEIDGTPVMVGVTHLQAGGTPRNAAVRAMQVEEILTFLDAHESDTMPVVLMGDFNLYDKLPTDDRSRRSLETAGFVDAAQATGTRDGTYPGYPDRFDRIYVRDHGSVSLVPEQSEVIRKGFSDHHAVEATLRLEQTSLP
jgi:endonuclease/exonuclease/phosphatase family metal-dependent hydrolase